MMIQRTLEWVDIGYSKRVWWRFVGFHVNVRAISGKRFLLEDLLRKGHGVHR
jgi:hypothetical protein